MRAAILSGGRFSIETVPDPVPAADMVVLEVAACGVCGTDHTFYRSRRLPDGATLGHEFAGTVAAVGRGVDGWKVGAPAAVVPIPYCGHCEWCASGRENLCPDGTRRTIGLGGDAGGMAELAQVPASALRRLPAGFDLQRGALVEPMAVAYHAVGLADVRLGTRLAIIGLGPIGLFAGMIAHQQGARVLGLDVRPARLACARRLGLEAFASDERADEQIRDLTDGGPEVVIEASGRPESIERAAGLARVGGRVVLVGVSAAPAEITPTRWLARGISLFPSIAYTRRDFAASLELIAERRIDVGPLVSSVQSLAGVQGLFERFDAQSGAVKVLIDPGLTDAGPV